MNRKHVVRNKIVVMVTMLLVLMIGLGSVSVAEPGSSSQDVETQQKKIAQSSDKETGDADKCKYAYIE